MTDSDLPQHDPRLIENAEGEFLAERQVHEAISTLGALSVQPESVLRPHQNDAYEKIIDFYNQGEQIGYVELPTGTGKTVLFVELCKQLKNNAEEGRGRSIILVPTVDLAAQTVGSYDEETGKRRGFLGHVRPGYSHRNVDIRGFNGRGIIDTITCHWNNMPPVLQCIDNFQLMLR